MLCLVQKVAAGDHRTSFLRWAQSTFAAARPSERGCMRLFARGHLFWKVRVDALQCAIVIPICRHWCFLGPCGIWDGLGTSQHPLNCQVSGWKGGLSMLQNLGRKAPNAEWLPKILVWLKNEKNPNLIWKLSDNNCFLCSAWKLCRELNVLFLKEIVTQIINFVCFVCFVFSFFFFLWTNIKYPLLLLWGRSEVGGKILGPKAASTSHQTWLC